MRHHRTVPPNPAAPAGSSVATSGVLGGRGRYRLHEEDALPLRVGDVRWVPVGPLRTYTCGITPYDVTHVGHASTFVWADVVRSVAHATGCDSVAARNVTDVDDVLTRAAKTKGWHYDELALTQEFLFDRDMRALSVASPTLSPRARGHVPAVIRLASALLGTGAAYEAEGHVYFRGAHVPARAGLDHDTALTRSREYGDQDDAPGREDPFDVAVWRPSPEDHPAWPSPWGWGRPGWHAECTAMALSTLGSAVDVLIGGSDLAFPHQAYQVAMAEAASGVTPFARTTLRVGEVRHEGRKMAKSTGNLVLVRDLLERHEPAAIRLALLHRPWQQPWDCTEDVFVRAASTLADLRAASVPLAEPAASAGARRALLALTDDLGVPAAVEDALGGAPDAGEAATLLLDVLKLHAT
jgi:L-cysteine:1D-myo-inositol 2-amino-2-deoxy-alpha-D-glucopyranoside ligase